MFEQASITKTYWIHDEHEGNRNFIRELGLRQPSAFRLAQEIRRDASQTDKKSNNEGEEHVENKFVQKWQRVFTGRKVQYAHKVKVHGITEAHSESPKPVRPRHFIICNGYRREYLHPSVDNFDAVHNQP